MSFPARAAFLGLLACFATPMDVRGQEALSPPAAAQLRRQYHADLDSTHAKILALAEAIPADKYGWRPAAGTRSISEVLMHLGGEWYFFCPRSLGADPPADFGAPKEKLAELEKITAKSEVLSELKKSWAHCSSRVMAVDPAALTGKYKPWNVTLGEAAFSMAGDQHEHLGQLIAYARSVGVKPPWSR